LVRAHAIRALGALGCTEFAGKIASLLGDTEWWVRLAAKETLVDMGPSVWRTAAAQLDSNDAFARDGAAEILQNMGILQYLASQAIGAGTSREHLQLLRKAVAVGGRGFLESALSSGETAIRARVKAQLGLRQKEFA
jgi:HEAT repeat protein